MTNLDNGKKAEFKMVWGGYSHYWIDTEIVKLLWNAADENYMKKKNAREHSMNQLLQLQVRMLTTTKSH